MIPSGEHAQGALTLDRLMSALDAAAAKLEAAQRAKHEPVAVIGLGCRFPGADDPAAFWRLLRDGVDATAEVPPERWSLDTYYDPDPQAAGKMYVRRGGFLLGIDRFDARFFGISPREAASMDPQQRLLLEVAWEALEHAGLPPTGLTGSATGVFVGATTTDYGGLLLRAGPATLDAYYSTGNALNAGAGRIAHTLGLQGPCLAVDSACSSSLVAVHLACQSLRAGECGLALAGGVNLILAPEVSIAICQARMLAPDGRCKTFDAGADGYARAEGCGVVVLKRLSDAEAAGDRVLALIRGSAVNQDGASSGFTVPNGRAQEALIRQALANAQTDPAAVDYLEAHGTGTPLGDPIEVRAAAAALGAGRTGDRPLLIGSAKTNIGHAEAAAGIAGLIKTVLALQHGTIPPHLHFRTPNPHIPWAELPVEVAAVVRPWPERDGPRLACVSAFGASGTNAHAVLQQAPVPAASPHQAALPDRPLHMLALSARSAPALHALAGRHAAHAEAQPDQAWADICFSANTGRAHLPVRAVVAAADRPEAARRLRALAASDGGERASPERPPPRVAFLFPGQGVQRAGVGRQLYGSEPAFRGALDRCTDILRGELEQPLRDVLFARGGAWLEDTAYAQPALFALGFALSEVWRSWGVQPAAVLGHSVGEYAAACAAGVFSLEDGLWLVAHRGRLMSGLPGGGGMAAVSAGEAAVREAMRPWCGEVSVAAVNAPGQTVISGSGAAIDSVLAALAASSVSGGRLRVSYGFHSPLVEPALPEFARAAARVRYRPPELALVSGVTGELAGAEVASPEYWVRHAREPVRFAQGVAALARRGCDVLIENGPSRTLLGLARMCAPGDGVLRLPSLGPDGDDWEQLLQSLGQLYIRGAEIDWRAFDHGRARARLALPTYPWQRESHWAPMPGHAEGDGDVDGAVRQLAETGSFSEEELRLAPRLLRALRQPRSGEPQDLPDAAMCYELAWRPQDMPGPVAWPAPVELAGALRPDLPGLLDAHAGEGYRRALERLEAVSIDYVARAWEQLGWHFAEGMRCPVDDLAAHLGVAPRHQRLLRRTAEMLAEAGSLRCLGGYWETAAPFVPGRPERQLAAVLADCSDAALECAVLGRCAGRLAEVLRGEQDPLQLLFPEGDATSAADLYRDSPSARLMNRVVRDAAAAALRQLPAGRTLRVLEIGAGTAGTTTGLLEILPPERTDYVFTDISPRFTTAAQERFAAHGCLRVRTLDIERDPAAQGFADEAPFDLIVAANVLHATKSLPQSLRHVRQLAAPGALLLLLEGTAPIRSVDLVFGMTEGWWRFEEDGARSGHPLICTAGWAAVLEEAGFAAPAALSPPIEAGEVLARQAVILARAAGKVPIPDWLILADRCGVGEQLARWHEASGGRSTLLLPDRGLPAAEPLRQAIAALDPARPCEIIHLWALDEPGLDIAPDAAEAGRLACGGAVELVQALADGSASGAHRRAWLVTEGAVAGGPELLSGLAQSGLWGLGRVVAQEHPELRAVRVDLDPAASVHERARSLWDELRSSSSEDEVRFRGGVRSVPRLVRHAATTPAAAVRFSADASYLITGGLGGLGLLTARWMAERGAGTLVLVGRRAGEAQAEQARRALQGTAATVEIHAADASRPDELAGVLERIAGSSRPLRGVVHAAGLLDDGTVRQLTWQRFADVMRPKLAGAWNLHRLTAGLTLDCFVLYSSFTAILGTPGQGNHAAANACLDALAWNRRGLGLPALSLGWGAWSEIGAAARSQGSGLDGRLRAKGGGTMTPAQSMRLLEQAWHSQAAHLAVAPVHWERLDARQAGRKLLAELAPVARPAADALPDVLARLRAASPRRRHALLLDHVLTETAKVLGLRDPGAIDPAEGFFALGMDSLSSVELRNKLRADLSCELPATAAFDHPTPDALARFVLGHLGMQVDAAPTTALTDRRWDGAGLGELSAAELDGLIDELRGAT